ncbi:MAG: glycosyltransferase family 4 protein [Flavobacteriales bacterium]|nr:glycosyltransferase family 4 protein [Flavobacteriales bacterium]
MKVLHICNDFLGSKVYNQLYTKLDELGIEQHIFAVQRKGRDNYSNEVDFQNKESEIYYSKFLRKYHKVLFRSKINYLYDALIKEIPIDRIEISHATTLFSDGAIAYRLYKKYNIPYIVTVRMTDFFIFLRFRKDLIFLAYKILKSAKKIIFISPSIKNKFLNHYLMLPVVELICSKSEVILNGVDDFWVENRSTKIQINNPINLLFVGAFNKNKNLKLLINSFLELQNKYNINLHIVGGRGLIGDEFDGIMTIIKNNHNIVYHGRISDKKLLKKVYEDCDIFVLPAINETFGLVYVEAISQNLPIIYVKNDGIDGVFDSELGESIEPNEASLSNAIRIIIKNYHNYIKHRDDMSRFDWSKIAKHYKSLYHQIVEKK